jgi:anti-sigma-K factor RskA
MSDESHLLAGEYVLGTLTADERAEAARRLQDDPAFRAEVEDWQRRLLPLTASVAPVAPAPTVWRAVERAIAGRPAPANDNLGLLAMSRARWRSAAVALGALAAALALFVADRDFLRPPAPAGASYVAAVNRGGDLPALIVRVDLATHSVSVRPVEAEAPAGKSLELWYVAAGQSPKSMGVIQQGRGIRMAAPADMPVKDTILAVSVEPPGGSPTGAPTGPVIYKGQLIAE